MALSVLVIWLLLMVGFAIKATFEPADWLFKSAYNPLLVIMVYSLWTVFTIGYFLKKSNNSFKAAEIHILRNGEIHKHQVLDLGFFEWYRGKKEIMEKATNE